MYVRINLLATLLAASQLVSSVPTNQMDIEEREVVRDTQTKVETVYAHPTGGSPVHKHHPWANNAPVHQHPSPKSSPDGDEDGSVHDPRGWGSGGGNMDYQGKVMFQHNAHRANHSAHPLQWSAGLAASAAKLAATCAYGHNTGINGGGYGQNIAAGPAPSMVAKVITDMFYNREEPLFRGQYGKTHPVGFEGWAHFTQVVWKSTVSVGCHTQDCSHHGGGLRNVGSSVHPYFTVCNYKGHGNVKGHYAQNVGRPLGHKTITIG
jgi:hypothetical protein